MMAAHGPNQWFATNGKTGNDVVQAILSHGLIGHTTVNPPWDTQNCGTNPNTGQPHNYCTFADAPLGSFTGGVTGERKIGVSQYEGLNGNPGTDQINNWYPVVYPPIPPEMIQQGRNVVHKSGFATGTTTGEIDVPCGYGAFGTIRWRPTQFVTLEFKCATRVIHAGWGQGDSGGPVSAREYAGGPYHPLGLQVGGQGQTNSSGVCISGVSCAFLFQRWSLIEQRLGVGPLYPQL